MGILAILGVSGVSLWVGFGMIFMAVRERRRLEEESARSPDKKL